jgi:hypothetical protein
MGQRTRSSVCKHEDCGHVSWLYDVDRNCGYCGDHILIEPFTMKLFQELKLLGATEEMGWFHDDESCGQHHTGRPDVMKCYRCKEENFAHGCFIFTRRIDAEVAAENVVRN